MELGRSCHYRKLFVSVVVVNEDSQERYNKNDRKYIQQQEQ